jgi:esterase/lipase superfamily enzyme
MGDFQQVKAGLEKNDYSGGFIGFKWRSDLSWGNSNRSAVWSGKELANFVERISEKRPDTQINLIGYSLGAKVVLEACKSIEDSDNIANVFLLAGAVKSSELKEGGRFFDSVESSRFRVWSFRNPKDQVLKTLFLLSGAVGRKGLNENNLENFNQEIIEFNSGLNFFQKKVHGGYIEEDSKALKRVAEIMKS